MFNMLTTLTKPDLSMFSSLFFSAQNFSFIELKNSNTLHNLLCRALLAFKMHSIKNAKVANLEDLCFERIYFAGEAPEQLYKASLESVLTADKFLIDFFMVTPFLVLMFNKYVSSTPTNGVL